MRGQARTSRYDLRAGDAAASACGSSSCTEILLFGGLFLLYSVYRYKHPADFHAASLKLCVSTARSTPLVLITSSLTAALAVHELREGRTARTRLFIGAHDPPRPYLPDREGLRVGGEVQHGLYPDATAPALAASPGQILYFGLYFTMTGLHALHVIVGMGLFGYALRSMSRGGGEGASDLVENVTLFWHLVDMIWIFLFPLFYLIS